MADKAGSIQVNTQQTWKWLDLKLTLHPGEDSPANHVKWLHELAGQSSWVDAMHAQCEATWILAVNPDQATADRHVPAPRIQIMAICRKALVCFSHPHLLGIHGWESHPDSCPRPLPLFATCAVIISHGRTLVSRPQQISSCLGHTLLIDSRVRVE